MLSSAGAVLGKRWNNGTPLVALTAWQLVFGGAILGAVALVVEGAPPALDAKETAGFAFTTLVATALAYLCWFAGLARLPGGHRRRGRASQPGDRRAPRRPGRP